VVADNQMGHDLPAMLAAIDQNTRVVFIANPNNPTGTFLSGAEITKFLDKVPPHVVVVLDEAYNEYLSPENQYDAMKMVQRYPNLLVSRSFSKAYGLAGLRVGFAVAQEDITDLLNRIRQPFNVNTLAQAAAAAALFDYDFLRQTYEMNQAGLQQLQKGLRELQLEFVPSHGNFLLVKFGSQTEALNQALLALGVIVRPVDNYGLSEYLRISVGTFEENDRLLQVLPEALQKAGITVA
jgi:histidinol-phosphate aminotransferase